MRACRSRNRRPASILPLVVMSLVILCGFVALAVDIGLIMIARTQCQNAADAAAMAGARTLTGAANGNTSAATTNAQNAAAANTVLGHSVQAADVQVQHGAYHYDPTAQTFSPHYPPVAPDNYNLTQATVSHTDETVFGRVWNVMSFQVGAVGVAAHRPRDVAIVLDYSGSMNNESDLWNCESYLGSQINTSNNTDPTFPQYGCYNTTFSPLATLQCTSADPRVGKCNVTQTVLGVPPLVSNFYQNAFGASTGTAAFQPAPAAVTNNAPGGDKPLLKNGSTTTPALTWQDVTGGAATKFSGYATVNGKFYGWTQGPGYWGKTFFAWPPDPVSAVQNDPLPGTSPDWRKRFFFLSDGTTPCNDNTKLFGAGGSLNDPPGSYVINYKNILAWIKANCIQSGQNPTAPFPPVLRAGNVLYYDSVPTDVPAGAYNHQTLNRQIADPNQRFWKEYIDYTLGVWRDPFGNIQHPNHPACSIGDDFTAGSATAGQFVQITGPDGNQASWKDSKGNSYINPTDNPKRPRHRFWFGPMTMIQWMSDTGLFPGTASDISMVAAKLGIQGALTDIQNNHPNDMVSMILFSRPHYQGEPSEASQFSEAQFSLSRDYAGMINALWFPPNSSTQDVRPWDPNGTQTPRAHGDFDANTATSYGFMLAYNQFSSNSQLRTQALGGGGRVGAQRLVVLETDGMANVGSSAGFTQSINAGTGVNNSYYNIGPTDTVTVNGSVTPGQDATNIATKLCALTTDTNTGPGFATPKKSVILHCLAFGAIFEPTAAGSEATNAMSLLQTLSQIGGTGFPSSVTDNGSPYFYKLCTGTLQQRQDKLRQAFSACMDDGIAIVLVQ